MIQDKKSTLFAALSMIFITQVFLAETIGVKIFSLEKTFGFSPLNYELLGISLSLNYTCGVLIWPVVFVMTDIINDFYGKKGVAFLSTSAAILILYGFFVFKLAIFTQPADFWEGMSAAQGVQSMNQAFSLVFAQSSWIIVGSLVAFIIGQMVDVFVFSQIKVRNFDAPIWVRATLSTLVSQFIDSFVVIYIAFVIGQGWSLSQFIAISINNYFYKFSLALLMIPILMLIHRGIERYLGADLSLEMRKQAIS
ncbi:MAG: queuosine precursor transporter [Chitinophagales bacterium]|jgi:hypothetical protein|nr:queuosine precursor transporter [Chitinophagales bacterium]